MMKGNEFIYTSRASSALVQLCKAIGTRKILIPINVCEIVFPFMRSVDINCKYYDVDPLTGNLGSNQLDALDTDVDALLVVHNFGTPHPMVPIKEWASKHGVFVIEDVCNALGAQIEGRAVGTFGDAAIYSFGYAKILEYGTGGACTVKDPPLRDRVRERVQALPEFTMDMAIALLKLNERIHEIRLQNYADKKALLLNTYLKYVPKMQYRLPAADIASIESKLPLLDDIVAGRKAKADLYRKGIKSPFISHIPHVPGQIYWRYNVLCQAEYRDALVAFIRSRGCLASTWYPPLFEVFDLSVNSADYPGSIGFAQRVINLFVDHRLTDQEIYHCIEVINSFRP
jgi:dTDP-4-amino-4,6-dideoxygalactose transaminase